MTNAKVYQGFLDDKKVEEHCSATFWFFFVKGKTVHHYERSTFLKKTLYSRIFGSKPDSLWQNLTCGLFHVLLPSWVGTKCHGLGKSLSKMSYEC